jgi:hypothetical protein
MEMNSSDVEEEVNKLPGILSLFHMTFEKKRNQYIARRRECFCKRCKQNKFQQCDNKIPIPKMIKPEILGERAPTGKELIRQGTDEAHEGEEYVVEKIVGRRNNKVCLCCCYSHTHKPHLMFSHLGCDSVHGEMERL